MHIFIALCLAAGPGIGRGKRDSKKGPGIGCDDGFRGWSPPLCIDLGRARCSFAFGVEAVRPVVSILWWGREVYGVSPFLGSRQRFRFLLRGSGFGDVMAEGPGQEDVV